MQTVCVCVSCIASQSKSTSASVRLNTMSTDSYMLELAKSLPESGTARDHFRLNQVSYTSTSCKGYGLQRYFLKRTESEVKVPEREIVWNDSSWEGSGLRRQFLRRIRSEKTVPAKERVWNDNSWEGSGLRRQFLKRINSSIFNLSPINVPR